MDSGTASTTPPTSRAPDGASGAVAKVGKSPPANPAAENPVTVATPPPAKRSLARRMMAIAALWIGVLLLGGWLRGKALLQILLEAAFEGVDRDGWLKLSRNWGVFFVFMAGLNEVLRLQLDFESWLWAKLWVFMPLSFLFTFSQIPMLLKHGLAIEDRDEVVKDEPPTA